MQVRVGGITTDTCGRDEECENKMPQQERKKVCQSLAKHKSTELNGKKKIPLKDSKCDRLGKIINH